MSTKNDLKLVVHEGGRKDLSRQLIRAFIEFRTDDARALVDRIAHRANLRLVDGCTASTHVPDPTNEDPQIR